MNKTYRYAVIGAGNGGKAMAADQLEKEAKHTGDLYEVRAIMKKLEQGNQDRAVVMAKKILIYEHMIIQL